jgi:hypothetical protein
MMQPIATSDAVLGAEHGGDHHIAPGLDAAVGAQLNTVTQAIEHQHLVCLGHAHFPGQTGIFHRALRAGAGAPRMARDQDRVGFGFCDTGRDSANARARHQLHADGGIRVDLL